MPTYVYGVILPGDDEEAVGETFEVEQGIKDPPLTHHPTTGEPVRRLLCAVRRRNLVAAQIEKPAQRQERPRKRFHEIRQNQQRLRKKRWRRTRPHWRRIKRIGR